MLIRLFTFLIIYVAAFYTWLYIYQDHFTMRMLGVNIFSLAGAAVCGFIIFRTFWLVTGKHKYFWLLLGIGTVSFVIAQSIWFYLQMKTSGEAPFPSWADFFWLVQYFFFLVALIYKHTLIRNKMWIASSFNIIILMAVISTLSLQYLIQPILEFEYGSILSLLTSLAYPVLDLGFLFATVSLYYSAKNKLHRKFIIFISVGFVLQVLTDSHHIYQLQKDNYEPANFFDPLWIAPFLLIALAGFYARRHPDITWTEREESAKRDQFNDMIPLLGVAVLLFILVLQWDKNFVVLKIGIFVIMLLIIVRQIFIIAVNQNLLEELRVKNIKLGKSEERYRQLVEISPSAIGVEMDGKFVYLNKAGLDMIGAATLEDIVDKSVFQIVDPDFRPLIELRHQSAEMSNTSLNPVEFDAKRMDGETIHVESTLTKINYNDKKAFLFVAQDITARKMIENKIKKMAYFDELTGLPNRSKFREQLYELVACAKQTNHKVAVLFVDLDRFKMINDSMGHRFGDVFLKKVAERLKKIENLKDRVFRLGGDEFCLLIDHANQEKTVKLAQKIIDEFTKPFILEDNDYYTSPSIGIGLYPDNAMNPDDLVMIADIAMYDAKNQGGNTFQFYSVAQDGEHSRKLKLEKELRKAIEYREIFVVYQPKVNIIDGQIIGFEALVRWQHPERGIVSPYEFISTAEETGLIVPIGKFVLFEACMQMKQWHNRGMSQLRIAVNISPRQFMEKNLVENISQILNETGLEPQYLEIELTESVMQNMKKTIHVLQDLKKLGVQISIDDFGTGYSSLSYLKLLPIDYLKIDKSFVKDIITNPMDEAIIQAIINMGQVMNMNVMAEGVEDEQQLSLLKRLNCNEGQGYLFSRPLLSDQAEKLLNFTSDG